MMIPNEDQQMQKSRVLSHANPNHYIVIPVNRSKFAPGFRLSTIDVLVSISGGVFAIFFGLQTWWIGLIIGFVVFHFFLFCNVFRMSRPLELIWAGLFTLLAGLTIAIDSPGWAFTVIISLCATLLLVAMEMRRPSYHGVAWKRINPGLREWWDTKSNQT